MWNGLIVFHSCKREHELCQQIPDSPGCRHLQSPEFSLLCTPRTWYPGACFETGYLLKMIGKHSVSCALSWICLTWLPKCHFARFIDAFAALFSPALADRDRNSAVMIQNAINRDEVISRQRMYQITGDALRMRLHSSRAAVSRAEDGRGWAAGDVEVWRKIEKSNICNERVIGSDYLEVLLWLLHQQYVCCQLLDDKQSQVDRGDLHWAEHCVPLALVHQISTTFKNEEKFLDTLRFSNTSHTSPTASVSITDVSCSTGEGKRYAGKSLTNQSCFLLKKIEFYRYQSKALNR